MDQQQVLSALEGLGDGGKDFGWIVDSYPRPKRPDLGDDVIAVLDRMKDSGCAWSRGSREYVWMGTDVDDPDYLAYADDEETGEEIYTPYRAVIDHIVADHQGEPLVIVAVVVNDHDTGGLAGFLEQMPEDTGIEFDVLQVERSEDAAGQPTARVTQDITLDVEGRDVLLLEWVVGTGCNAACVVAYLREKNAGSVKICAILDDVALRTVPVQIDYCVAELERKAVIGVAKGDGFNFPCLVI